MDKALEKDGKGKNIVYDVEREMPLFLNKAREAFYVVEQCYTCEGYSTEQKKIPTGDQYAKSNVRR